MVRSRDGVWPDVGPTLGSLTGLRGLVALSWTTQIGLGGAGSRPYYEAGPRGNRVRGSLFTSDLLERGIRETDACRGLDDAMFAKLIAIAGAL